MENYDNKIMATRCNLEIEGNSIEAVVDSGASTNIMTQKLQELLNIEISEESNITFIVADGKRVPALGKAQVEINLEGKRIPIEVQIMESGKRELILGNEFLLEKKGNIDYKTKLLTIEEKGKTVKIPITFSNNEEESEEELSEEEFEDEEFVEDYEYDDRRELYTTFEEVSEDEDEIAKTQVLAN